jgi:hypothetical protein
MPSIRRGWFPIALVAILAIVAMITPVRADPGHPNVTPGTVFATLAPGESITVVKEIITPTIPPQPDIVGLTDLPITVIPTPVACDPLDVSFAPSSQTVTSGDHAIFVETIAVPNTPSLEGTSIDCFVEFIDEDGPVIGHQDIIIEIPDVTPPVATCTETINPHGDTIPPAGSTTLPGPRGGQNEDGFYLLEATDNVWPPASLEIFVNGFGPFDVGDVIKYTQDDTAVPSSKDIGSDSGRAQADAVAAHIIGNGDASVVAVDGAGNVSDPLLCLVPEPPK